LIGSRQRLKKLFWSTTKVILGFTKQVDHLTTGRLIPLHMHFRKTWKRGTTLFFSLDTSIFRMPTHALPDQPNRLTHTLFKNFALGLGHRWRHGQNNRTQMTWDSGMTLA
jgi:hypothetical protein